MYKKTYYLSGLSLFPIDRVCILCNLYNPQSYINLTLDVKALSHKDEVFEMEALVTRYSMRAFPFAF